MFEIGGSLREARLKRNLTLADVQKAIRIRDRYLQALEETLASAGRRVRQGVPAHIRRLPRPQQESLCRGVQQPPRPTSRTHPRRFGGAGAIFRRRRLPPPADRHRGHRRNRRGARGLAAGSSDGGQSVPPTTTPTTASRPRHHTPKEAPQDARPRRSRARRSYGIQASRGLGSTPAARTAEPFTRARSCRARRCP